ncbi:hypothetical protein Fmac_024792 [Flemingia macrophylla]|uniref:DUF761 domain-containing protein n=1 Tax=Flemingia macrophylla TaxID=520843 RepID=A0ABD1LQD8_9FABA
MSRTRLSKKLQPAKKAWKSVSNTFQYKFHKLNISKAFKATLQRLLSAFHSLGHLIHSRLHHHHSLMTTTTTSTRPRGTSYYHVQHKQSSCAAIHIDDLFNKANSLSMHDATNKSAHAQLGQGETSQSKEKEKEHGIYEGENLVGESSGLNTIEDAWKAVVAKSPQLHVDQKAEEFISKFREDMRLQKERSMLEFQEMLARSS